MRLSATRIRTYLQCPRRFRYVYVEQLPTAITGPLALGKAIHETLRMMYLRNMETGSGLDAGYGLAAFDRLWRQMLSTEKPLFKNGETTATELCDLARTLIHGYVIANRNRPPPLVLEFPFEIDWLGHELVGVIDRIDEDGDCLILTDYKSGQRKPSRKSLDGDLQLTIYAFAIERLFGRAPDRIVYYHLRTQEPLPTWRGPDRFQTLQSAVLPHVVESIDACLFPPQYGWECKHCDFRNRCLAEGPGGIRQTRTEEPIAHQQVPPLLGRIDGPGTVGLPHRLQKGGA